MDKEEKEKGGGKLRTTRQDEKGRERTSRRSSTRFLGSGSRRDDNQRGTDDTISDLVPEEGSGPGSAALLLLNPLCRAWQTTFSLYSLDSSCWMALRGKSQDQEAEEKTRSAEEEEEEEKGVGGGGKRRREEEEPTCAC
eukprot:763418-Hanusia_phi.AAC.2